ncbi:DHH family phosphoesterase [Candidatus Woesearchaeota archaeon]|nr:DHH family phosphoesterase [Candidatus Woesearchaeota archaeon]
MKEFLLYIKECAKIFKEIAGKEPIRIVGHLDCDGITSSSIIINALHREGIKVAYSSNRQLNEKAIKQIKEEPYKIVFFTDFGSNTIKLINEHLNEKTVFILDHHKYEETETKHYNINPNKFGLDDNDICGAGVAYFFSKALNLRNKDLSYIALIGIIGDNQDKNLSELNKHILNDAKEKVEIIIGLNLFGTQTRPIHKVLEYSTDIYIPGVSGNESGAISFLENIGIKITKEDGNPRMIFDLSKEETSRLTTAIIISRIGKEENAENVLGNNYLIKKEKNGMPTRDAREFSTLLNACGRLNRPSLGVGTCLSDENIKEKAIILLKDYKKEIINSLNWIYEKRNSEFVLEKENLVIINAQNNIKDTMIGTVNSILTKSGLFDKNAVIVSMAHSVDETIKISLRSSNKDIDLSKVIGEACSELNGAGGGHPNAAGGSIPINKEKEFIENISEKLQNRKV